MEIIVLDDNKAFASKLYNDLGSSCEIEIDLSKETSGIAENISKFLSDKPQEQNPYHLFINLEGRYNNSNRQDQKGVEILLWLRCKYKLPNPVILYGFQSNQSLLKQKPENLIINSKGSYYYQLPYNFSIIKNRKFTSVANLGELKKFLKPAFSIEQFRHREANWWGVYRMFYAYNLLFDSKIKYPREIYSQLNSLNWSITEFIFQSNEIHSDFDDVLFSLGKKAEFYRRRLSGVSPKILYIDDQAFLGWDILLKNLIYSGSNDKLNVIVPQKSSLNELQNQVVEAINNFSPDIVLLDLRLYDETDWLPDPLKYSGAEILKLIKERFLSLPVIMFTASNKSYNLKKLLELGCETMWTKEGIDEGIGTVRSLYSLFELLELIYKASNKHQYEMGKKLYETDIILSKLENNFYRLNQNYLNKNKTLTDWIGRDIILTDTGIWLNVKDTTNYYCSLYLLMKLKIRKILYEEKKEYIRIDEGFKIIDDVLLEIMRYSKRHLKEKNYNEKKEQFEEITDLVLLSRFALRKIWDWYNKTSSLFGEPDKESFGKKMRESELDLNQKEREEDINYNDTFYFTDKWYSKLLKAFNFWGHVDRKDNLSLTNKDTEIKIEDITIESKHIGDIHADDTFKEYIHYLLKCDKSVLFISDDTAFINNKLNPSLESMEAIKRNNLKIIRGYEMVRELQKVIGFLKKLD